MFQSQPPRLRFNSYSPASNGHGTVLRKADGYNTISLIRHMSEIPPSIIVKQIPHLLMLYGERQADNSICSVFIKKN